MSNLGQGQRIYTEIVRLLAPTLGQTKSEELVLEVVGALGYSIESLDPPKGMLILNSIAPMAGVVGVAARLAQLRFEKEYRVRAPETQGSAATARDAAPARIRVPLARIKQQLAPVLGSDKATDVVDEAAVSLRLLEDVDRDQALRLFDHLARAGGLVASAAHFAKARVLLDFGIRRT